MNVLYCRFIILGFYREIINLIVPVSFVAKILSVSYHKKTGFTIDKRGISDEKIKADRSCK